MTRWPSAPPSTRRSATRRGTARQGDTDTDINLLDIYVDSLIDIYLDDVTNDAATQTWPREQCRVVTKRVVKTTPRTGCNKVPRTMCTRRGCSIQEVSSIIIRTLIHGR